MEIKQSSFTSIGVISSAILPMPSSLQLLSPNINLHLSPPSLHMQNPKKIKSIKTPQKHTLPPRKRKTKSKTMYYNKHTDFHKFQNQQSSHKRLANGLYFIDWENPWVSRKPTTKHKKNKNLTLILPLVLKQKFREATKLVCGFVHTNSCCCCCFPSLDLFSLFPRKKVKIFWKKLVLNPLLLSCTTWADFFSSRRLCRTALQV